MRLVIDNKIDLTSALDRGEWHRLSVIDILTGQGLVLSALLNSPTGSQPPGKKPRIIAPFSSYVNSFFGPSRDFG